MADFLYEFATNMPAFLREVDAGLAALNAKLASYKAPAAAQLSQGLAGIQGNLAQQLAGLPAVNATRAAGGKTVDAAKPFRDLYKSSLAQIDALATQTIPGLNAGSRKVVQSLVADLKASYALAFESAYAEYRAASMGTLPNARFAKGVLSDAQVAAAGVSPDRVTAVRADPVIRRQEQLRAQEEIAAGQALLANEQAAGAQQKVAVAGERLAAAESHYARVLEQIALNADPAGRPRDPLGARQANGLFYDANNQPFRRVLEDDGQGGARVVPNALEPVQREFIDELDELTDDLELRRRDQKVLAARAADEQRRSIADRKHLDGLDKTARERHIAALTQSTIGQLETGRARRLAGGFIELEDGGFVRRDRGQFRPLREGTDELLLAQDASRKAALAAETAKTAASKKAAAADLEEAAASHRAAVANASRLERLAGTVVGGPAGMPGVGRGLGVDDLLHTGLSFTRYMASAAVIGGGLATLVQAKEEILDYTDSVRDLDVAMRRIGDPSESFKNDLTQIASISGSKPGEAIDTAARAIRAFAKESENAEGRVTPLVRAVSQLSLITGKTIPDLTGDMVATLSSFNLDPTQASRAADAIVAARDAFGGDGGQISQGLALISATASEAGFQLEEVATLIGLVQARTDQSGQAIATRLSRIISIIGGSSGKSFLAQLNASLDPSQQIDLSASLADQFKQIQDVFPSLSDNQQQRLFNRLGGTSALRELIPLLSEGDALSAALADSLGQSGEAADEFNNRVDETRAQLKQIAGSLREIVIEVAESGFLDIVGLAIEALDPALDAVSELLKAYNELPRGLRTVIALTLQAAAAAKIHAAFASQAAAANAAPIGTGATSVAASASRTAGYGAIGASAVAGQLGARPIAGAAGTALLSGLKSALLNPLTLTVGGTLIALRSLESASTRIAGALDTAAADIALTSDSAVEGPEDVRNRAAQYSGFAESIRASSGGLFGSLANLLAGGSSDLIADFMERNAAATTERAQRMEQLLAETGEGAGELTVVTGSVDSIRSSVEAFEATGRSSADLLAALTTAMDNLGAAAKGAAFDLDPVSRQIGVESFGQSAQDQIAQMVSEIAALTPGGSWRGFDFDAPTGVVGDLEKLVGIGRGRNESDAIAARMAAQLGQDSALPGMLRNFMDTVLSQFAAGEAVNVRQAVAGFVGQLPTSVTEGIPDQILGELQNELTLSLAHVLANMGADIDVALLQAGQSIPGIIAGLLASGGLSLLGSGTRDLVGQTGSVIFNAFRETFLSEGPDVDVEQWTVLAEETLKAAEARAERIRLQGILMDDAENAAVRAARVVFNAVRGLINRGRREGVPEENLGWLRDRGLREEANYVQEQRNYADFLEAEADRRQREAEEAARAAEEARRAAQELRRARTLAGVDPRDAVGQAAAELNLARAELAEAAAGTAEYYDKLREVNEAAIALAEAHSAQVLAFQRLESVDPESQLDQAAHAVREATDQINRALPGTKEWADAQYALLEAQMRLSDAQVEANSVARQLRIDLTDPVAKAREELATAMERLRADQERGASQDVLNQGQLDVVNAQTNLEAAAFSQRLQDAQTANQLGELSHRAYLDYLQSEHDRLSAIQDRTRQQTEQLLQIDQALRAASETLQGMFNLGEIRIPTPYEVRRALAGTRPIDGPAAGVRYGTVINNQVRIDGTDFNRVVAYLEKQLGLTTIQRTGGTATRKF